MRNELKVGDWTESGQITKIQNGVHNEDSFLVRSGQVEKGDPFSVWYFHNGGSTPKPPKKTTEEAFETRKAALESNCESFFEDNPRFSP